MKRTCSLLVILALTLAAKAQQGPVPSHATRATAAMPAKADLGRAVARVNGVTISERDAREQMQRLFPYYAIHGGKVPEKYQAEIRKRAIQELIGDELMFQEAKREKITLPAATMQDVIRQARQRFGSPTAFEEYGKRQYGSVEEFERRLRRATVIAKFEDLQITQKSKVSDARLRQLYDQNEKMFLRPESVWLQSISVNVPPNPSEAQKKLARQRMEELLPQARACRNYQEFGLLAEKGSEDAYRVMMGDHKWVHVVGLPEEMSKAIAGLQPGQVSGIVELAGGLTILRVNQRRPQKQMEFSEVRDKMRADLEEATRKDRRDTLEKRLRQEAHIEIL